VCASLRGLAAGAEPALDHSILQPHKRTSDKKHSW
jgi:hypothetical protein